MSSGIFAVTVASNSVSLDDEEKGSVNFTVFNNSGRRVRARARTIILNSATEGWLKIAGDAEHDFLPNTTHSFTVLVEVPPGMPAGKYIFRLDAVGIENPEDDYAEGPVVSVEVAESKPDKVIKKPILWGRVVISAVLSAIISLAIIIIGYSVIAKNPARRSSGNPAGDIAATLVGTLVMMIFWTLLYFPIATLLSALLISLLVQYRRFIHILLAVVVSVPVALIFLWLISLVTK